MKKTLLALICLLAPTTGHAQPRITPATHTLALQVGTFMFDRGGDESTASVALRASWKYNRFVWGEVGAMGSRVRRALLSGSPVTLDRRERATLAGLDVGVQAQLPLPVVQPYIGVATGFFGYFEGNSGNNLIRPSHHAMGGVRTAIGQHLGLRAELRARFDQFSDGGTSNNFEQTVGISWRW
jgi:hypothetical protein